jgi:hypothetical protein
MANVDPGRIDVDGETFDVRAEADVPGQYHFTWLSGKNPGYGFTCLRSDGQALTRDELIDQIRNFLAQIDPDTGHIPD